jgi:glycosyltransferase involved in cell wall biosynthesis
MRIAFLYGSFSLGERPIDTKNLFTSPRGLTGSEISCIMLCRAMQLRGHDAHLFIGKMPREGSQWDVAYSWLEPDQLRTIDARLRMVNQQVNDFAYCHPGFDEFVDIYTSPSETHKQYLLSLPGEHAIHPDKWVVIPNGVDPSQYDISKKVPGRVIYASSPDRGLHLLLEAWPEIKRRVPHAHLRVFYEMSSHLKTFGQQEIFMVRGQVELGLTEVGYRIRYIQRALELYKRFDVENVGSVSRERMALEMSEAEVLAYPCDTIRFTEGFSVTTMEACAAGAIPVVVGVDALQEIYGELPTCIAPGDPFAESVMLALMLRESEDILRAHREIGYKIAQRHAWPTIAERLEKIINDALADPSHNAA